MKAKLQKTSPEASFRAIGEDEREELIRSFLPLVKRVVHRLAGRLPSEVDIKEMLNSGIIGLVDALEKYDPRHETNFSTYAQFRIRGTILDSFRVQDWAPRSLRNKAHKIEACYQKLEQELGRAAEDHEVAEYLGVDLDTLQKMLGEVTGVILLSLDELGYGHGEERLKADESLPSSRPDPLQQLLDSEKVELVARALDRLPEKERLVITLYFYEELNLKEIGDIIGVTESRASQIRTRGLLRLKSYLKRSMPAS
ncbi:MAG TPA: FliA/WhiG family RNA polymerase sigma factor [Oligoflexia bacterium]|nr:FliA/WhiG family RNA polymerase sigma factor [Oligoflexia bacterium]HMP48785.1 FliA/WhiG family RNA polymerase sigma factor [Oligoflexia bacterium]